MSSIVSVAKGSIYRRKDRKYFIYIPADKAIKASGWVLPIRGKVGRELEKEGAYISRRRISRYCCISCAIHRGIMRPRAEEKRRKKSLRRRSNSKTIPLKFLKKQIM